MSIIDIRKNTDKTEKQQYINLPSEAFDGLALHQNLDIIIKTSEPISIHKAV